MNRPHLRDNGSRGAASAPRDPSRAHTVTAQQVASSEAYAGRTVSIGSRTNGVGRVTLTGAETYSDAVVLAFRYRNGRTGSRRLDPSTTVLIHRTH